MKGGIVKLFAFGLVLVLLLSGISALVPATAQASTDAVLILHFDEGSGTIVKDASGHGNGGIINGATWTTGISGKALSFDGLDDFVDVPDSDIFDGFTEFSVSMWIKLEEYSPGNWPQILQRQNNNNQGMWCYQVKNSHNLGLTIGDGSRNTGGETAGDKFITVPINEWHFVAFTYDGTTIRNYLDGEYKNSFVPSVNYLNSKTNLYIGGRHAGYFDGSIDEVGVWNRALSPEEIKAHYLAKRAGGSTEESASDLISSVSTSIDILKRNNIDTSLIEEALNNAQNSYDLGKYDEANELAQNALKIANDAHEAQQYIGSAQSEINEAKSIGADVKDAENKLKEAMNTVNKGNYEYAQDWADDASELAKHSSVGSVQIKELKALATKYDERTVVISGTCRDIETVYAEGYKFSVDDDTGMILVVYPGSLGDIQDGDKVLVNGIFEASDRTVVADDVKKAGVGDVPGFEAVFAITGLLAVAYLIRRRQ